MSEDNGESDGIGLHAFEDAYDIVGELRGADDLRFFLARRRTSAVDVMITVVPAGAASANNALTLYAADINLLSGVSHAGVLQAIEGCWLDAGAFAAVTERPRGGTIGERLASGDRLESPQVATLLREVNGALEWARSIGVVHRGVNVDAMFLEPNTQRLAMALLPTPIAASGVPGQAADARTIGDLAWTLLAGRDPESDPRDVSLSSARPDLPQQVVTAVHDMREATRDALPDVGRFIAVIATADVLKEAEADLEARRIRLSDDDRHREQLESESEQWKQRALTAESLLASPRPARGARPKQIAMPLIAVATIALGAVFFAHRQSSQSPARVSNAPVVVDSSSAAGTIAPATVVPPAPLSVAPMPVTPIPVAPMVAPTPVAPAPTIDTTRRTVPSPSITPVPPRVIDPRPADSTAVVRQIPRPSPAPDTTLPDSARAKRPCAPVPRDTVFVRDSTGRVDTILVRRPTAAKCDTTSGPP